MRVSLAQFAINVYTTLLPVAWIALTVCVLVLLPMAAIRTTRPKAGVGLFLASWIFGLTTWFLGAAITFASWGWVGLIIGILFFGIGVVPMAIIAAIVKVKSLSMALSLIVMLLVTWFSRIGGGMLAESSAERQVYR